MRMQQNGKIENNSNRNIFQELLAAKRRVSIEPSYEEETLEVKQNVRVRRFSQKLIADEVKELEKRHNSRDKKLKAPEDMCNSEAKYTSLKNITFDRFLKKDLETHIQSLEKEGKALTREEEEDLGYETFKMTKQKEKLYLSDLRDKINSGSISTSTTFKYKSSLAYSHLHLCQKRQI